MVFQSLSSSTKPDRIHRVNCYNPQNAYTYYPVAIVGAGESGIAMGCRLKDKLGFDQFRIFDRHGGIGGTWWINRYPGVACDIAAPFYSFSFCMNPKWTSLYPSGAEIQKYLQDVCSKYKITDKIELNTDVEGARWLEDEQLWEVTLKHLAIGTGELSRRERKGIIDEKGESAVVLSTEKIKAKILISAVGGFVEPKTFPDDIPGKEDFKGDMFHSARWDYSVDFKNKDVVVVGTGCSSAQFVPTLRGKGASSVTQLMRSPPWVMPRMPAPGGDDNWAKFAPLLFTYVPGLLRLFRLTLFLLHENEFRLFGEKLSNKKFRANREAALLKWMKKTVPEKYHEILTPDYGLGCKRRIGDNKWYPGLNDPQVDITTLPLTRVHERSVTLGPGRYYPKPSKADSKAPVDEKTIPADVLIMANGFDVHEWLHPLKVTGRNDKDLIETMMERGGPQAYLGTAMDGFPNFFIIFGPNTVTGHSSVILASENMANYSLNFISKVLRGDAKTVEVKREAELEYTRDIQESLSKTVFMSGGCSSWYYTADGWNSTVYPYSQIRFGLKCMFPNWSHWNIERTRKGQIKRALGHLSKLLAFTAVFVVGYRLKKMGLQLRYLPSLLKTSLKMSFVMAVAQVIKLLKKLQAKALG